MQVVCVIGVSGLGRLCTAEQSGMTNLIMLSQVQNSWRIAVDSTVLLEFAGVGRELSELQDLM
jgi:hypothetical protein